LQAGRFIFRKEEANMVAERQLDEILAVFSHELRNPLAPIRNAVHILHQAKLDDPDVREARVVIDRQVQQLGGILDDLLDVFRLTHQQVPLRKVPLDLAELVRRTVGDYHSGFDRQHRGLSLDVPSEPIWVLGEGRRLGQVVANLLHNALKYTRPGDKVVVRVTEDADNRQANISVRDTGIGINAEALPHVFDTFFQGQRIMDNGYGGLGLGLALVRSIVLLHNGQVQVESDGPGMGTLLTIRLPLTAERPQTARDPSSLPPRTRRLRILIVEDNMDAAVTLARLLGRYGHEVTLAYTGEAGLVQARDWHPDVVLCDLGLPQMDGFAVAQALRHDPATASTRLIAVTGYGQDEDRHRSDEAGFDLHLTKPVDPKELQRLLAVLQIGPA
jgi:two-component system, sensor histidine kinase